MGSAERVIESISALLSAGAAWHFGFGLAAAAALLFIWAMLALTFIDFDTQYLPDNLTLPLLWAGLVVNLFGVFVPLSDAVMGAIAGYLVLWSVYWLFKLATGKEGMGFGDFKLLAAIGAWLGWQMLPVTLLLSSAVGAAIGVAMIVMGTHKRAGLARIEEGSIAEDVLHARTAGIRPAACRQSRTR